ncbi:hypothetical protein AW27_023075 [Streptomyces sp. PCS3-D2]|uniref:hypothetical protein n=1 Tax=Streptomyces sp. PCS3-D2 TaxID=1460244 RepID=UPI0004459688|nr:hypothetical protein [Streptomyces sp. PCS3-D2]WKV74128.1 hypothetical protein AW27_023075 [Streptomyces sp. PCS3-D2]
MGAVDFDHIEAGPDVEQAFHAARDAALYEHGRGGYTGSIAEKDTYLAFDEPRTSADKAYVRASQLLNADRRISDKRGPAGALPVVLDDGQDGWLFFGWASH